MNTMKVSECEDLMTKVNTIAKILDDDGSKMDDNVYLSLYNALGELCKTELLVKIETYSKKNSRKYRVGLNLLRNNIGHLLLSIPISMLFVLFVKLVC